MFLTPARRAHLEKLASYLEGLPADYSHFDMGTYFYGATSRALAAYARKNGGVASCGTSACAVGHGPSAGILVPPRFVGNGVDWVGYEDAMFTGGSETLHSWLFSGGWNGTDDTPHGAAARIRLLLTRGSPPEGFKFPSPKWRGIYTPFLASVDTRPKDEDPAQTGASLASGAVGEAETPNLNSPSSTHEGIDPCSTS